ncbi:transposase [Bacillus sp. B190/17]|uniref:Transposase n=1 Tax=Bacillus lumedeiriae TaxID=3058829 RepID=A0ABW8I8P1_9BACI
MARKKRIWIPHRFYHIVCRGNRRDPLFRHANDFQAFFHILNQLYDKYPFELASYCLMTNHFHLQMRSQEHSISKVMSLINKRYANYYNTRYRLTGHVFEKRFFDQMIDTKEGMLNVSRYIHLNPVEAKMIHRPELYRWSSCPLFYYNHVSNQLVYMNIHSVLDYFTGTDEEKKKKYIEAMKL